MVTDTRLGKSEQAMRGVALAFVAQEYGLSADVLEAVNRLGLLYEKARQSLTPGMTLAGMIDLFCDSLSDHYTAQLSGIKSDSLNYVEQAQKMHEAAGLFDEALHLEISKRIVFTADISALLTIDDLLSIDRQIYEAWQAESTAQESEAENVE